MMSAKKMFVLLLPLAAWAALGQDTPKRVTLPEATAAIVSKVPPEYPAIGRQLKIQGKVELEAVVAQNGTVETVTIVRGNPVLTKSAAEAVKKWKFTPFQNGGKPCRALAPLSISFKL
jgi:protein TonB